MKKLALLVVVVLAVVVVYNVLMYYDNNFPYGRMRETPAVRPHEKPILIMAAGIVPYDGGEAVFRAASPESLDPPMVLERAEVIEAGRTQYATYCRQCHGSNHDGNGTVGQSFMPLPTDLRLARVQNAHPGYLFKHISYGIGGGGRQPALGTTIEMQDRWRIIAYIKSLGIR